MYKFLIVGSNFINKGAQSMLFVTVDQLRKRYPDCEIYMLSAFDYAEDQPYSFQIVFEDEDAHRMVNHPVLGAGVIMAKDAVKKILGKPTGYKKKSALAALYPEISCVIDISGFALSSSWEVKASKEYLRRVSEAKRKHIPVILMPQSFGPFSYGQDQKKMDRMIRENLSYPKAIFAREKEGVDLLQDRYHCKNIFLSPDLVLCHPTPEIGVICRNAEAVKPTQIPEIPGNTVGVIPNMRTLSGHNKSELLDFYKKIIETVLDKQKNVALIRHSREDLSFCKEIKTIFAQEDHVQLLTNDFDCFSYDALVQKLDFIIGARYHSLVHAFKAGIPCIAIGWAVKYLELFRLFGDEAFVFDVRKALDIERMCEAIRLYCTYGKEKKNQILQTVSQLQKCSCFDAVEQAIKQCEAGNL